MTETVETTTGGRHAGREVALQVLYALDLAETGPRDALVVAMSDPAQAFGHRSPSRPPQCPREATSAHTWIDGSVIFEAAPGAAHSSGHRRSSRTARARRSARTPGIAARGPLSCSARGPWLLSFPGRSATDDAVASRPVAAVPLRSSGIATNITLMQCAKGWRVVQVVLHLEHSQRCASYLYQDPKGTARL